MIENTQTLFLLFKLFPQCQFFRLSKLQVIQIQRIMDYEDKAIDQPKIRVVIRTRPLNKKEQARNEQDVVDVLNNTDVIVREQKVKVDLTKYIEQHQFKFDYALSDRITNAEMYQQCVRPIVQCAFMGAKVTCFAYGQTGSGKTYTMNGDVQNGVLGMYYLGADDIFSRRDEQYPGLEIYVSFFEIYCGKLFDLLNGRQQLQAREDAKQNVNIVGLTVQKVSGIEDFMNTIAYGSSVRITSQNSTNSDSSRSHAILQIDLKYGKKNHGKISFIDLAGCERGADTLDQNKQTKIDGAQINKSLLALKECIRALDQGKNHTPFRGSKLTMVLKDSFTGFCKTLMIGNISPGSGSCENTLNTLRYADRVKELKKGGSIQPITKEQRMAKELMLPRNGKTKMIITNQSDSQSERGPLHPRDKNINHGNASKQQSQVTPQPKKPKYILKDENKNSQVVVQPRKNLLTSQNNTHQEPLKSVNHFGKSGKPQVTRNKSVICKQKGGNSHWVNSRAVDLPLMQLNSQRESFHKNSSVMVSRKDLKDINIHLHNQLSNLNSKPSLSPRKQSTPDHILNIGDYRQWDKIVDKFKQWTPSPYNFAEMSQLYEELVKFIMREELQMGEFHKRILMKEQKLHGEFAGMYQETQTDNKNNQEMHEYAGRLSKFIESRMRSYQELKCKAEVYQNHLREHDFCESKLIEAGELIGRQMGVYDNIQGLQYASHHN